MSGRYRIAGHCDDAASRPAPRFEVASEGGKFLRNPDYCGAGTIVSPGNCIPAGLPVARAAERRP